MESILSSIDEKDADVLRKQKRNVQLKGAGWWCCVNLKKHSKEAAEGFQKELPCQQLQSTSQLLFREFDYCPFRKSNQSSVDPH